MLEKTLKKILLAIYGLLAIAVIIGVLLLSGRSINPVSLVGGLANPVPVDLVGTKTGTSTAGVGFSITGTGGQSATSTYPYKIGNEFDSAIFSVKVKSASSTANAYFSFIGSNDSYCDTTATSSTHSAYSTYGGTVLSDVNWFDLGDHLKGKVHSTSLSNSTSTLGWVNPVAGAGRELILTDLDSRCVALQVSGSSTALWIQLRGKNLSK